MYKMSPYEECISQEQMRMLQGVLPMLILLGLVLTSALVHAQSYQSGFISIDCGIVEGSSYTDDVTNINYVSDAGFIDSGEVHKILPEYITTDTQLTTLTSFPNNTRNCYTLKPTQGKGNRYLIRARFMYGDYDSMNGELPEFDIYLGPDYLDTIRFNSSTESINRELIHVLSSDYIHVCLVNTGRGTPFISAIELRLLTSEMYTQTKFGSLYLFRRLSFGIASGIVRYKADIHDRIWSSIDWPDTTSLYTTNEVNTQNIFDPPSEVMRNAITPKNTNSPLKIDLDLGNTSEKVLIYMYFAEIEILNENQKREFSIEVNGDLYSDPFSPDNLTTTTTYPERLEPLAPMYTITIKKTLNSTLPPIVNALEVYTAKLLPQRQTYDKDAAAMWSIKSTYRLTKNWQGDPCAPQEYVWDGIRCSYDDTENPRIVLLNLSTSGLNGEIFSGLANLTMMQTLDLSNNNLTGTVPDFLSGLNFIRELNLKGNNFIGPIPSGLLEKAHKGLLFLSYDGESSGDPASSCDKNTCKNKKDNKINVPLIVGVLVVVVVAILIALAAVWVIMKKKRRGTRLETRKKQYTYSDIQNITNNFSVVLGKGAFGTVYRGTIGDTLVAIKMLSDSSNQGEKEFQAEAYLLLSVHHKNLTALVGYCNDDSKKGIIYEYMANGNLENRLLDTNSSVLTWEERLQIACDVAHGLEYMHHGCKTPIVHRDVKCTNILLNEAFQAKLGDFGLSKAYPIDGSHISTIVVGTPGYLDPEYSTLERLTAKSDVYSFGVVLLVLITGQPAIIKNDNENLHISRMVSVKLVSGDMNSIVDPTLSGDFDVNSAWIVVELALACVAHIASKRPTMKEVVIKLNDCLATERARKEGIPNQNTSGVTSLNLELAHDPIRPV